MTRDEAYKFLTDNVKNKNLLKHHLAAEAVMTVLAKYFNSKRKEEDPVLNENDWAIVGLLHDADYEQTRENPKKHAVLLSEKLAGKLDETLIHAILAHNKDYTKVEPSSLLDWSLYCSDELTGLIVAAALIHPDKKLSSLTVEFILNRFSEKSFAKGANRKQIKMCEEKLEIPVNEFIDLSLRAMQSISLQLEL
ncbi:MAG: phosphohydrolase [Candidatus Levyibacteriota bacterium]